MYLSQLILNPRSRSARYDLADRFELHRTILAGFPSALPEAERVLFRVENARSSPVTSLLVQSHTIPNWQSVERLYSDNYLVEDPLVRMIDSQVNNGQIMPFRLQANPTVKRNGKRYGLARDEEAFDWLQRKATQHGFQVDQLDVRLNKLGKIYGKKRERVWFVVQFDGRLQVTDSALFATSLKDGIGSAKAFGCGLLSVPYGTVR